MSLELKFKNKQELEDFLFCWENCSKSIVNGKDNKLYNRFDKRLQKLLDKKKIKISSGKSKGRFLQKWICSRLAEIYNLYYNDQDDLSDVKSRPMGLSGTDIIIQNKDFYDKFLFDIECKNTETINLYANIKQAKKNTKEDRYWLLVHKKNYSDPIVVMDWKVFEYLLRKIEELSNV